jgi:hypothetical protein
MRTSDDVGELAQELGVTRRCLYKWRVKRETAEPGDEASRSSTHAAFHRKEILQLKRLLADKTEAVPKQNCASLGVHPIFPCP